MVPISLQGGEPTVYPDWIDIVLGLDENFYIDLLTNLNFDVQEFAKRVPPRRLWRDVPYAPIRVSYHPGQKLTYQELLDKCGFLQDAGFDVGIFMVDHPMFNGQIPLWRQQAQERGLDFRTKEFLGVYAGKMHGEYRYPNAVKGRTNRIVNCRTTELLIAPDGHIHRCHRDLYAGENQIGHILGGMDGEFKFRTCLNEGECSSCDVKRKTDRFQKPNATSVEIEDYYGQTTD
jgi:hypothetical protein